MEMKGLSLIIALASGGLKAIGDITLNPNPLWIRTRNRN